MMGENKFLRVCAHKPRPPSIRILLGSKYEMFHLKGWLSVGICLGVGFKSLCLK
jgi:hypothetical protein